MAKEPKMLSWSTQHFCKKLWVVVLKSLLKWLESQSLLTCEDESSRALLKFLNQSVQSDEAWKNLKKIKMNVITAKKFVQKNCPKNNENFVGCWQLHNCVHFCGHVVARGPSMHDDDTN